MVNSFFRLLLLLVVAGGMSGLRAEPSPPDWIWTNTGDRMEEGTWEASRTFALPAAVERATLRATVDFSGLKLTLNGETLIDLDPYDSPLEIDMTRALRVGENSLIALASGTPGPSAIAISLEVIGKEGDLISLSNDAEWKQASGEKLRSFGPVEAERWALHRLPEVSPFAEYNQWKEALEGSEKTSLSPLPPGFEIEKIRDAAEEEGSWISLAIDAKGRLLVGRESKGLLRMTLSPDRSEVLSVEVVEETLGECRGLAWLGDTLYVHANHAKALYALRDSNGDDHFDEVRKLQSTEGGAGHGRNDLAVHGGTLHAIVGDNIAVPVDSPQRARPEIGAPAELGHSIRVGFGDGENVTWEAMNRGLRNPYGIDFNPEGEAFTYDADNEGDVGLPFYHPTRILHLVSGANYGWRQDRGNTRSFPLYAPESVPGSFEVGRGSPTAVKFGTRSGFPSPWKESLFALDWAYGRIVAVHLAPHGAGYLGSGEIFLEGRPLNVTDLDFDDEGTMWFVTGGRKTKSALYRVRYTGKPSGTPSGTPAAGAQATQRIAFSAKARDLRKSLERFHGKTDPAAITEVWPHLGSPDPWIRNAARVALEWQPVGEWRMRALAAGSDLGGLTARLALARAGTEGDRVVLSRSTADLVYDSATGRIGKLTLMRIYDLSGVPEDPSVRALIEKQLATLLPDLAEPVHRERARLLAALGSGEAVAYALERFASNEDQLDRLHYLEVLSETGSGWEPETSELFFTTLSHAKRFSYGDRLMAAFFQGLEENALSRVVDAAGRERYSALLAEEPEGVAEPPELRSFVKHWTMEDFPDDDSVTGSGTPDPVRGREFYTATLCAACHVCGTTGRPVGPDLTTVASRFGPRDLVESILDPSAVVSEVHRNVVVSKKDGTFVQGRIVQNDFRESTLTLATNPFAPSELVTIPKADILSWEESPVSPMPPALLDTLTREEIRDLVAFLLGGGRTE